jgi:hypothetical protein
MIQVNTPTLIVCDLESERDLSWGSVVSIHALDTDKWYKIVNGAYLEVPGDTVSAPILASNLVVVKSLNDFPAPSGSVITLVDNTAYQISGSVNIGTNTIVCGVSNSFFGNDRFNDALVYTGTGDFITIDSSGVSKGFLLCENMTFTFASGTLINSNTASFRFEECSLGGKTLGTIVSGASTTFRKCGITSLTTGGITFTGSGSGSIKFKDNVVTNNAGILLDLGTATFGFIAISRNSVTTNVTQTFLKGTTGGSNTSISALVTINQFTGAGTVLDTITVSDTNWMFIGNVGSSNTVTGAQGFQGLQGAQGLQGLQGSVGTTGSQGFQGLQGSQGSQGSVGTTGNQGFQGDAGTGSQGAQGSQGADGGAGAQGFQGATGTGSQGSQGFQGNDGGAGAQGSQGFQGASASESNIYLVALGGYV